MKRYEHILWDWNGTLLSDVQTALECMNGLLERRALPLMDRDHYTRIFRFPVEDFYRDAGLVRDPFPQLSDEFISAYIEANLSCPLQPGVRDALAHLEDRHTQSVLSAAHQDVLERDVARLELTLYFTALRGLPNHHARSKVAEGRDWLAGSGLAPPNVVMIGDTDHDAEVAHAIGIDCALLSHGHQDHARLQQVGVPVFPHLEALVDWLG